MAAAQGNRVTGEIMQPHVRPRSTVFRAESDAGTIYLKLCGDSQAHEPVLTMVLAKHASGPALHPVAVVPAEE